jgi:hypothetical protein
MFPGMKRWVINDNPRQGCSIGHLYRAERLADSCYDSIGSLSPDFRPDLDYLRWWHHCQFVPHQLQQRASTRSLSSRQFQVHLSLYLRPSRWSAHHPRIRRNLWGDRRLRIQVRRAHSNCRLDRFPFIATHTLDGASGSALETLEHLTYPDADRWLRPLENTYWAAVVWRSTPYKNNIRKQRSDQV